MNKLLVKILWGKQSFFQLVLTMIALVIGVSLMAVTINLYLNFKDLLSDNDAFSNNYLVVNKSVGYLNTFGFSSTTFDDDEIADIKGNPLILDAEGFKANQFDVELKTGEPINLRMEIYFESISKKYIDKVPSTWTWKEGEEVVPIIMSTEFYNLMSFGFTPTKKGIPQIPKSLLLNKTFDLYIRGEKGEKRMKTQIVGYSDRINSLIVPQEFLNWANANIGKGKTGTYSRVMLEVEDASSPGLNKYLEENGYVTNKDQLLSGSGKTKIKLFLSVLGLIGGLIVILTLNTLVMNIQLLVSKAKAELKMLFSLGYRLKTLFGYMFYGFLVMQLLPLILIFVLLPLINSGIQSGLNEFMPNFVLETSMEVMLIPVGVFVLSVVVMALFLKRFLRLSVLSD
ncbi:MAG: hypothetical protein NT150_07010 [Bacteroidetes bacterium]|nr:hypothetical protein [Bacteroidota bacterium]